MPCSSDSGANTVLFLWDVSGGVARRSHGRTSSSLARLQWREKKTSWSSPQKTKTTKEEQMFFSPSPFSSDVLSTLISWEIQQSSNGPVDTNAGLKSPRMQCGSTPLVGADLWEDDATAIVFSGMSVFKLICWSSVCRWEGEGAGQIKGLKPRRIALFS